MAEVKPTAPEKGLKGEVFQKESPELQELKARLERLEMRLAERKPIPEEKEKTVKQEIKSYLRELQQTPIFAPSPATRDEAKEIKKFEPDQQVGALISLVFEKGLTEAISVARALENPAILDEFHDTLVDHYYKELVEQGLLKL